MPGLVTRAIVLRAVNYRENDRMLTLLTPEKGILTAIARGCRKPKSPLMPASEWFVCGTYELVTVHQHIVVTGCEIQDTFYPLREDMERLAAAGCMAAVCEQLAQPEQAAQTLYGLLLQGLYFLAYDAAVCTTATTAAFLLKCIDEAGYRPRLKHCVHCGRLLDLTEGAALDFEGGGLICDSCKAQGSGAWVSRDELIWMCDVLRKPFSPRGESGMLRTLRTLRFYAENRMGLFLRAVDTLEKYALDG